MSYSIAQQIVEESQKLGIGCEPLSVMQCQSISDGLLRKYTACEQWPSFIWECLTSCETLIDEKGWIRIKDYSPERPVILLFAPNDEEAMFKFANGADAAKTLNECFGYEVYFTDESLSYFLLHNHHDCVIACGEARSWLSEVKRKR